MNIIASIRHFFDAKVDAGITVFGLAVFIFALGIVSIIEIVAEMAAVVFSPQSDGENK